MKTVGIIGYGSFGEFLVNKLEDKLSLKVYDPQKDVPKRLLSTIADVACCDFVVLAIPVDAYHEVLAAIKPLLRESTVIVDISSVKTTPVSIIDRIIPNQCRVIMHPLFGPQSAEKSFWGHVVVMCPTVSSTEAYREVRDFIVSQGLAILDKTPEEHDKEMAYAQGLTFYLARILLTMGIHDVELLTPSFKKLLDLAELESHHSEDLFRTIQTGNPYLAEIRSKFVKTAELLNSELAE
jgi:prephenate dehydrogenase